MKMSRLCEDVGDLLLSSDLNFLFSQSDITGHECDS